MRACDCRVCGCDTKDCSGLSKHTNCTIRVQLRSSAASRACSSQASRQPVQHARLCTVAETHVGAPRQKQRTFILASQSSSSTRQVLAQHPVNQPRQHLPGAVEAIHATEKAHNAAQAIYAEQYATSKNQYSMQLQPLPDPQICHKAVCRMSPQGTSAKCCYGVDSA